MFKAAIGGLFIKIMDERIIRARMLLGEAAMKKLKCSHVAVFGLGGVGS